MSDNNSKTYSGGVGFGGLLFLLFLGLKLTGHIDWSWWWVTSPLWIPLAVIVAVLTVIALIAGIVAIFSK